MDEKIREQWESNAEAFTGLIDGEGTPHHKKILNPCVERLLGDVEGKQFLDAGCGEGYLSRYYAKKGAIVTAIDLSERLIETSEQLTEDSGVTVDYRVDNVCYIESVPNTEFDIILSNLVLLNVPSLDDAIKEFHRVLKVGGILVFSIVHPAFNFYEIHTLCSANRLRRFNRMIHRKLNRHTHFSNQIEYLRKNGNSDHDLT